MIALFNYKESPIQLEDVNGQIMANATLMCKAFNKQPNEWLRLESTKKYIDVINSEKRNCLIIRTTGNPRSSDNQAVTQINEESEPFEAVVTKPYSSENGGGTWICQALIVDLARWLDVRFAIWCDERIAELSRNGYVGNVPALPVAEIAEMKELLTKQSAELSEIKALLDQRIIRSNRPTPREESALSQQEKDQIVAFWDALNESKSILLKKEHWTVDHEYLYISIPKMMPYFEPYCMRHELDFINAGDLKDVLLSGRYAPYVASTQKGTHNSHKKAGFGRCYRFRYEVRDNELFIGDKKITFARLQ